MKYTLFKLQYIFIILFCINGNNLFSQKYKNYNKISLETNLGLAVKKDINEISPKAYFVGEIASRYMFSPKHGLKFDVAFVPLKRDINYTTFHKSFQNRYSLQYIVNLGRLLHFEKFAPKFSGLVHVGAGISTLKFKESLYFKSWKSNLTDETINLTFGLTPQYRINDKIEIHTDFSFVGNLYQEFNKELNFKDLTAKSIFGRMINFSFGGTYYIGKHKQHVDWAFEQKVDIKKDSVLEIVPKEILAVNYDKDKDGVLDSLDICPEEFGLVDFDGCPQPELTYDCNLNDFPIITFKGARYEILDVFKPIIDSIAKCLIENKSKKIIIYGYADNFGDSTYKQELSQNRANQLRKEIVLRGVDPDRIFAIGEGIKKAKLKEEHKTTIKHNRLACIESISNNKNDIRVLESNEFIQGLFFTVQIGAYKKIIKNNKFNKLGKVLVSISADGYTRYHIDMFTNYEDAFEKWKTLRQFGFAQDAFVTAYYLGERITLKEAQLLILEKGKSIIAE